jgi:hypothetical protein
MDTPPYPWPSHLVDLTKNISIGHSVLVISSKIGHYPQIYNTTLPVFINNLKQLKPDTVINIAPEDSCLLNIIEDHSRAWCMLNRLLLGKVFRFDKLHKTTKKIMQVLESASPTSYMKGR